MRHIEDEFDNLILPVQYDDILWYRLNRRLIPENGGFAACGLTLLLELRDN